MQDEICMCRKRIARFLLEHEDNKFRGAFSNKHVKTTKKQPEKKATKSDEDKVKGTKDGDKGEFQRIQGEFQRIQATYSRLDGRSIPSALDCSLRRKMKVQVDRSASPFTKPDGITQNLGDKDMRLQLFNKIIDNEELSRYILCFAFNSSVVETCTDNDLIHFQQQCFVLESSSQG
jgi:hypothetical protein